MQTCTLPAPTRVALWRDIVCPKEHGSWSLALEPLALGLLVAPSWPGAALALALVGGFFARRPVRMLFLERRTERRVAAWRATGLCGLVATMGFVAAVAGAGTSGWWALLPMAAAGAVFAWFDVRGSGREEIAELAGATAFGLAPIAIGVLGALPREQAIALGILMTARSAPSVATVRAFLRAAKTGVRQDAFALIAVASALAAGIWLAFRGAAPWLGAVALAALLVRTVALLVIVRPSWRAKTLGMLEAVIGLVYVALLALAWPA